MEKYVCIFLFKSNKNFSLHESKKKKKSVSSNMHLYQSNPIHILPTDHPKPIVYDTILLQLCIGMH